MRSLSDEQLAKLVQEGRSDAYSILVERYQKQVFALAYRLGGDYDEAQDMAQEAFLRVYQELPKYDSARRFFPWMYRVAHNTCVNQLARRPKDVSPLDNIVELRRDDSPSADPNTRLERQELGQAVSSALQALPAQYRLPLVLKYLEGMTYQQIGEELNLPLSTIETRLFRGRRMLREALAPYLRADE